MQAFDIRPEAWLAVPLEGEDVSGRPGSAQPPFMAQTVAAGATVSGWVEFDLADPTVDVFLDYRDPDEVTLFMVALF
jgi:hypothetical protein